MCPSMLYPVPGNRTWSHIMHDFSTVEINKYLITTDEQSHVLCLHSLPYDKSIIRCQELLDTFFFCQFTSKYLTIQRWLTTLHSLSVVTPSKFDICHPFILLITISASFPTFAVLVHGWKTVLRKLVTLLAVSSDLFGHIEGLKILTFLLASKCCIWSNPWH